MTNKTIRGTWDEIASKYAGELRGLEVEVRVVNGEDGAKGSFDPVRWDHAMRIIESFRGKLRSLPDEAFTTESLYD